MQTCPLILVFALSLLRSTVCQDENSLQGLNSFINDQEELARSLAAYATDQYARRIERVRSCEPSMHECSDSFAEDPCSASFGTPSYCTSARGRRLNSSSSVFATPPSVNLERLPDSIKESICMYRGIEGFAADASIWLEGGAWVYIGTRDGHFRIWPGSARPRSPDGNPDLGGCNRYDPRLRPWFIGASTGPKDIILIVDKSGSMDKVSSSGQSKWQVISQAVHDILDTFTFTDFVNIVTFSDEATSLWTDSGLVRGESANLAALKSALSTEFPSGNTNFAVAFGEAFRLLKQRCSSEPRKSCSNCQKIILFLTDGEDTSRSDRESIPPSEMISVVNELQDELREATSQRAVIFTYSITRQSDDSILRQIACANDGAWSLIDLSTNPLDALNSYFSYVAAGRSPGSPIWIEPYEDANGLGSVTTVAMPFYARQTSSGHRVFLGVVGIDVRLKTLEDLGMTPDQVFDALIDRSESCTVSRTSDCEMQLFRSSRQDRRSICPDPFPTGVLGPIMSGVLCYEFNGIFYKRFSDEVTWNAAMSACEEDGGQLTSVGGVDELAFLANLASPDGSWIGARPSESRVRFKWLDRSEPDLVEDSDFWGISEPYFKNDNEHGVVIDRRGVIGNLRTRPIQKRCSFICEYVANASCTDGQGSIPERGFFNIPPVSYCEPSEYHNITQPVQDVRNLDLDDIMYDVGMPALGNEEVICCSYASFASPSRVMLFSFLLIVFFLI